MIEAHERGNERYAAFGLRVKQLVAVKSKLVLANAKAAAVKANLLAAKAKIAAAKLAAKGKAAALANARYTAYSSDVGEAFRPMVPEGAVKATYGLAVSYILGDIGYTTWKEHEKGEKGEPVRAFVHATVFQGIASLALPMFIIHQVVHVAQNATKKMKAGPMKKWGPTIAGLALIPALPYAVDEPCEHAIDYAFDRFWPKKDGSSSAHGHEAPGEENKTKKSE